MKLVWSLVSLVAAGAILYQGLAHPHLDYTLGTVWWTVVFFGASVLAKLDD